MYEIFVLFNGYSEIEENGMKANCSCTLLKGEVNIIVDTLTPWDGDKLKKEIEKYSITCEDIKYVICTHSHSDHTGCNYLFPNALLIVGYSISMKDFYFNHNFDEKSYVINEFVEVIATPGHTLDDVTVIVKSKDGIVAITGDLFEKEEDLMNEELWISAGSSNEKLQRMNRNKILEMVDWIVPGHGPMFKVPARYKKIT